MLYYYIKNIISDWITGVDDPQIHHTHSKYPPTKLTRLTTRVLANQQHYFSTIDIVHKDSIKDYKIIFIYRNPIEVIYSRFIEHYNSGWNNHLKNIQCQTQWSSVNGRVVKSYEDKNGYPTLKEVIKYKEDLYGMTEFFNNYVNPSKPRNYKIYCVKYEDFFDNIKKFNKIIGLPDNKKYYPTKKETNKSIEYFPNELKDIYSNLIHKIENMPFIKIV